MLVTNNILYYESFPNEIHPVVTPLNSKQLLNIYISLYIVVYATEYSYGATVFPVTVSVNVSVSTDSGSNNTK